MKITILLSATLILLFNLPDLHAQNSNDSSKNSLVKGSWSAQFELGTYLVSGQFEAFLISPDLIAKALNAILKSMYLHGGL